MDQKSAVSTSTPKIVWGNIIFFTVTTLLGVIGAPIYIYHHGISWQEIALFAFYMVATGMSITVGYHRLFAHRTFESSRLLDFLVLFFGAAAFEQSALYWSSQHRDHHRYVDTDQDPYSIKKGFFYAHIGWLIFWEHKVDYENAKDLQKNNLLTHQNRFYVLWAVTAGILFPLAIGALSGHVLGALLIAVSLRLTIVYHSTFCINSVCHMFGKQTYDIHASARDHWFVALLTNGEGYHNFHHRFPGDYRNGIRWYDWDPSKWMIAFLAKIGLASDLKRVSRFSILAARLEADNRRMEEHYVSAKVLNGLERFREGLQARYQTICQNLSHWEEASSKYQAALKSHAAHDAEKLREIADQEIRQARQRFQQAYEEWNIFIRNRSLKLEPVAVR